MNAADRILTTRVAIIMRTLAEHQGEPVWADYLATLTKTTEANIQPILDTLRASEQIIEWSEGEITFYTLPLEV